MQNFELTLSSPVADSFRCVKAANSLDIDMSKKSVHHFKVAADIKSPFNLGVVVGASGSGKTTLAKHIWGEDAFKEILDLSKPVIDQFLSDVLPGGVIRTYGLFHGNDQIGFQCFANYTPRRPGTKMKMHSNRTVIHPDYAGLGMGIMLINKTSTHMVSQGFEVWAKYSSTPVYLAMKRQPAWKLVNISRTTNMKAGENMLRKTGFRNDVKTYSFRFIGEGESAT
jgi:hypothetical protein